MVERSATLKSLLHRIYCLSLIVTIAIASVTLAPFSAQAETTIYQNAAGSTQLSMDSSNPDSPGPMEYTTKTEDEAWFGEINPKRILRQNGNITIYGTFQDSPGDRLNDRIFCTGDVIATRRFAVDRFQLNVNWTVTGGQACTETGTQFQVQLTETTAHSPNP
jgi:hypothetical protein